MNLCEHIQTMPYGLAVAVKNIVAAAESNGAGLAAKEALSTIDLLSEARNLLDADIKRRTKALAEKETKKTRAPKGANAPTVEPKAETPAPVKKAKTKPEPEFEIEETVETDDDAPEMEKVNGKWRVKETKPAKEEKKAKAKTKAKPQAKTKPVEDLDDDLDEDEDEDLPEIDLDEDEDDETADIDT